MSRFVFIAVVCGAAAAVAQDLSVSLPGVRAEVRGPSAQVAMMPAPRTIGVDRYRFDRSASATPRLVVNEPAGATAQVWSDRRLEGEFTVPFSFAGRPGRGYRVIVSDGEVTLLDYSFELMPGQQVVLGMAGAARPAPRPSFDFDGLKRAMEAESFASDKLGVLRSATQTGALLTCAQVGELIDLMDMSSDKVAVVEAARGHVVDPQNGFRLSEHFDFSSDKEKVRRLMSR